MNTLVVPLLLALLQTPPPEALHYRFEEVKSTVRCWPGGDKAKEVKVAQGDGAASGDTVRTGWWGRTVLSEATRGARFEVYASTQVKLTAGEPGVLLTLEQGRIKCIFQALVGGGRVERRVAVPGALLAVRGTTYGVEVDKAGRTTLAVFEGVVEILGKGPHAEPILVKAGEWSTFGPSQEPKVEANHGKGFEEKAWSQGMRPDGSMAPGSRVPAVVGRGMPHPTPGPKGH